MGKKVKKIHRQGRIRRGGTVDIAKIIEQANEAYRTRPLACPFCGEVTTLGWIDDNDGCCPCCKHGLREEACDEAAVDAMERLEPYREARANLARIEGRIKETRSEHGVVHYFMLAFLLVWRFLATCRVKRLDTLEKCDYSLLGRLKTARYYAGSWYSQTRIALGEDGLGEMRGVQPWYKEPSGTFALRGCATPDARGFRAEFEAFEELRRACNDPNSPLFGGRLVANLYLPYCASDESRRLARSLQPIYSQVDLILLTRRQVFVIEVKTRGRVIVNADRYSVSTGGAKRERNADWMIDQVDTHAEKLCELYPELPSEHVLSVLEFVRPRQLEGGFERFRKGLFIGEGGGSGTLVPAMEAACEQGGDILTQERIDRIADELVSRYGDPSGMKRTMHIARLQEIEERWSA